MGLGGKRTIAASRYWAPQDPCDRSGRHCTVGALSAGDRWFSSEQIALDAMEQYNKKIEKELCELLRKVDGVGDVQVMITLASSEERVTLQNDSATTESTGEDGTGSKRQKESATTESVLVRKDGQDTPYLVQILTPEIEGVVVVASGADSGQTDTEIIAAVQALFPVQAHKIRVMKMK